MAHFLHRATDVRTGSKEGGFEMPLGDRGVVVVVWRDGSVVRSTCCSLGDLASRRLEHRYPGMHTNTVGGGERRWGRCVFWYKVNGLNGQGPH